MDTKAIHHSALITILLAFLLLASACGRMQAARPEASAAGYTLSLAVQPDPPAMGHAQLLVTLTDPSGRPVDGAQVHVEGNMTHAGMVPAIADAKGSQDGRYAIPFDWTMDGDWVVTVKATLPDGQTVNRDFPIRVGT